MNKNVIWLLVCCTAFVFAQTKGIRSEERDMTLRQGTMTTVPYDTIAPYPLRNDINPWAVAGYGTVLVGTIASIHIYQANAWWSGQRSSFHFQNDWAYARWTDKLGHFYSGIIAQHFFSTALEGSGMIQSQSEWWGAAASSLFQLYIEVEDGFGPNWGFSPGDAAGDLLGAFYPVVQYYYPPLKNYIFKWSYYPKSLNKSGIDATQKHIVTDDYEGQKYWFSVRMKEVLPDGIAEYWPAPLCLALGYGVRDLDGSGGGKSDVYIALDFDLQWLPLHSTFWRYMKNTLNYYRLPMPGVRITNGIAFFGLCY